MRGLPEHGQFLLRETVLAPGDGGGVGQGPPAGMQRISTRKQSENILYSGGSNTSWSTFIREGAGSLWTVTGPKGGGRSDVAKWGVLITSSVYGVVCILWPGKGGEDLPMSDDQPTTSVERALAAKIVGAYLRNHQVPAEQLASLISTVHEALGRLGKLSAEPASERTPAVSIRRSVQRDFVVCIECGWKGSMLRRHLTTAHGLTVDQYRARWSLPADHAMTAPAYSERRSTMAKQLGLGRGGRQAPGEASGPAAPESPTAPQPRRRGRPRSKAMPA